MRLNHGSLAHLERGGLVLTRDLRQARILRRLHDRARIAAGLEAWPTAQVLPLDAWLTARWREAAGERDDLSMPLGPAALDWLWRRETGADAPALLDPADLGQRARASWLRLRRHGGDVGSLSRWPLTHDQRAFAGWARAVESALAARRACDPGDLAREIVARDALPPPGPPLMLAGFRRPVPAIAALARALGARGWTVGMESARGSRARAWRHAAADPESERAGWLAWLRARLEQAPDGIHAAIVPDLAARRGALERALAAVLQPEAELPGGESRERVFDLSGGLPLEAAPVVEIALDAIRCASGRADEAAWSRLLRTPHAGAALVEGDARVRLDLRLREAGAPRPAAPGGLAVVARRFGAPQLAACIEASARALAGPACRSAATWAEAFGACLAAWGWPGDAALESATFQAAARLRECLGELSSMASLAPELTAAAAIAELGRLCARPFQPESGEPVVFVLDACEDPGFDCDSLWVAGLTAASWPGPVDVDPLLPIELQRRLAMPGVTAADCVEDAAAVIDRWRVRAAELVLSWPRTENDTAVDGSALVDASLPALSLPAGPATRERLACGATVLETLDGDAAPPLAGMHARGGARVLELQSACPFRAFAELRLRATALPEPRSGSDRRVRGQVLHRALEDLWGRLGGQAPLLAMGDAECAECVAAAVDAALDELCPAGGGERSRRLERDWQRQAIAGLLALERRRPGFEVLATERELDGRIGGLELQLRVDRVDRVGGELVLIDYKTGRQRSAAWRGARMDAPQLPLYAVLHPRRPAAVAIAEARPGDARFVGVAGDDGLVDGLVPAGRFELTEDRQRGFDWSSITRHWRAWLERLARDHAEGCAEVDPKLAQDTCRHCHLGALCRVSAVPDDDAPAEAGDDG